MLHRIALMSDTVDFLKLNLRRILSVGVGFGKVSYSFKVKVGQL